MIRPFPLLAGSASVLATLLSLPASADVTQADRQQARALLEEIIAVPTAAGEGNVPRMAEALAAHLKEAGFTDADIQYVPVDKDGEKTVGLVVRYAGSNPDLKPIAILGHMDVVGALPSNWQTDPFVPTEKDGYLYGRGSTDNKAGVAAVTSTFIRLKKEGFVPERTLLIAFSGDEESGMKTTRALTENPWVSEAVVALNADAGSGSVEGDKYTFSIQSAEKTFATFHLATSNPGGHSSAPRPDNAIYDLAFGLTRLWTLEFPVQFNEITRPIVERMAKEEDPELGAALTTLLSNPEDKAARETLKRYPHEANILWTTCVPTMLSAGNAENALPQNAVATVNCRIFPGTTVESVRKNIVAALDNPAIEVTVDGEPVESPVSPPNPALFAALTKAVKANYPTATIAPSMSAGGTDGKEFRSAGIPTYGAGSLALKRPEDSRAHGIDERVPLQSFYKELDYWDGLLRDVSSLDLTGGASGQ